MLLLQLQCLGYGPYNLCELAELESHKLLISHIVNNTNHFLRATNFSQSFCEYVDIL